MTTQANNSEAEQTAHTGLTPFALTLWISGFGILFVTLFSSFLFRMFRIATHAKGETLWLLIKDVATTPWNNDWSHAIVIPLISAYFVHQNRYRLKATQLRAFPLGLPILLLGMFFFAWWIYGRNDMFQGYSVVLALFGLLLFLLGPGAMKTLWFPILYLVLAVKISDRYWGFIAWKLQIIAAHSATVVLQMIGIDASVGGSTITLNFTRDGYWVSEAMNVAEACSGLRMLMAFIALGAAMAYLGQRTWWQRLIMFALAIPIAVLINVGRVTVLGILFLTNRQLTTGDFHSFIGLLMLIPAALLLALVGWVLDHLLINEVTYQRSSATSSHNQAHSRAQQAQDKAPEPTAADEKTITPTNPVGRAVAGLIIGASVTGLLGLTYGLALTVLRPDLWEHGLQTTTIWALLGVALCLLLAVTVWGVKILKPESRPSAGPGPAARWMAVGVLLTGILGLGGVVKATKTVLIKHAIDLREPLYRIPNEAGVWELVREDPPLNAESIQTLGTTQYISRVYRDRTSVDPEAASFARLHVAYYTGTPDTVPHVPDRCFVAGGLTPINAGSAEILLAGPWYNQTEDGKWTASSKINPTGVNLAATDIAATIFTYAPANQPDQQSNVLYFFAANGKFLSTPDLVRLQGFDPRDRYSYYCKIEVGLPGVGDPDLAAKRASDFLSAIMPEIMACLPDWERISKPTDEEN